MWSYVVGMDDAAAELGDGSVSGTLDCLWGQSKALGLGDTGRKLSHWSWHSGPGL